MTDLQAENFLNVSYEALGYNDGDLLDVYDPTLQNEARTHLDKGQWLELCRHINHNADFRIEKIFFIDNSPVIVFVDAPANDRENLHEVFKNIWCMARPRILFLATPGELFAFDLSQPPARTGERLTPLKAVAKAADVTTRLKNFRREHIESGNVYKNESFAPISQRADNMLIEDLKTLRRQLIQKGLDKSKISYAHALIGRSIFIRYLEDRNILNKEYFDSIAAQNENWQQILDTPPKSPAIYPGMADRLYVRVLSDIDFTFALFAQLSIDFNGNMFPSDSDERTAITSEHLLLIRDFLTGAVQEQTKLFFWAYRFDIIPIELISNIYEEFHHYAAGSKRSGKSETGTHYTPIPLVEFVLSRTLTVDVLEKKPRIIDPACGSGIFLVEGFRRIVRYESHCRNKAKLSFQELEDLLKTRIAGVELNEEAVRITAFSLYIAFLHFQESGRVLEQIRSENRLPNLIYTDRKAKGKKYFDILLHSNAFTVESSDLPDKIKNKFTSQCADVVIGNPPWGSLSSNVPGNKEIIQVMKQWAKAENLPEQSDNETTQVFLWRSLQLLKPGGICGLLVSAGFFLKDSKKHRSVKNKFLSSVTITEFVNFTLCRQAFFTKSIAPFGALFFKKETPLPDSIIRYRLLRKIDNFASSKEVVLDKNDFKFFIHRDTVMGDIWKIYLFGNHRDHALISRLRHFPELREYIDGEASGEGYKVGNKKKKVPWLNKLKTLTRDLPFFPKYGPIPIHELPPGPLRVEAPRENKIYKGLRLIFKKAPVKKNGDTPPGQIRCRLETADFAYSAIFSSVKLKKPDINDYKIVLAVLRSAFARYYFFMTASRWGGWHDEVLTQELHSLPIVFPSDDQMRKRLVGIVDAILNYRPELMKSRREINELEAQLDEAVFDLYSLSHGDRELIRDRCRMDIDAYCNGLKSVAYSAVELPCLNSGTLEALKTMNNHREADTVGGGSGNSDSLSTYLETFLMQWAPFVDQDKEFLWQVIAPPGIHMTTVIFTLVDKNGSSSGREGFQCGKIGNGETWQQILGRLSADSRHPIAKRIYIDGMVKIVGTGQVIIIKRSDMRLWTRSAARDDADATLLRSIKQNHQF